LTSKNRGCVELILPLVVEWRDCRAELPDGTAAIVTAYASNESLASHLTPAACVQIAASESNIPPLEFPLRKHFLDWDCGVRIADCRQHFPRLAPAPPAGHKPYYTAPEWHDGHFTRACPVFSLGLILYEILTGQRAFAERQWLLIKNDGRILRIRCGRGRER
jgi:hypothetical protein